MSSSPGLPSQEYESSELANFRAEWRAELESRKRARQASASTTNIVEHALYLTPRPLQQTRKPTLVAQSHPVITSDGEIIGEKQGKALTSALSVYKQAIQFEQAGDLDQALTLYKQAFRMDSHVDRAFHREEMLLNIAMQQSGKKKLPSSSSTAIAADPTQDDMTASIRAPSIKPRNLPKGRTVTTGLLDTVVAAFLEQEPTLNFVPQDETQPLAIKMLPEEILLEILHMLDSSSIETFALVCRKARVLTLESSIWRNLVLSTYREPQIPDLETLSEIVTRHIFDYRRVFIEQPRVRTDGVYIAICHYIRPGLSENQWVNVCHVTLVDHGKPKLHVWQITHLITYHRYLRFYPNGQVLSLLANEEHPPQTIINVLKPSLRMKGLYIGTWSLAGTQVVLSNLLDASGRYPIASSIKEPLPVPPPSDQHHPSDMRPSRYVFVMSLELKSRPLGRWNRLDIHSYDTLNLETGDLTPVALKHERPFWFSKVRSYV